MHMAGRIHVVLDEREHAAFRATATAAGESLSEWLRRAGRERMEREQRTRLTSVADLRDFFRSCDEREIGGEPDWSEHLAVATRSRAGSVETT